MSSDNTGWLPPSGNRPSDSPNTSPNGASPDPEPTPAPRYGAYGPAAGQPQQPAYGQYQTYPGQAPSSPPPGSPQTGYQGYGQGSQYSQYAQPADAYAPGAGGFFLAPKPGIIPLRPLSITEIIGGAFESLRANPRAMFLPALLVMGVAGLLSAVLTFVTTNSVFANFTSSNYDAYDSGASDAEILADALSTTGSSTLASFLTAGVTALATALLTGLLIVTVSRSVLGRIATPAEVWERTKSRIWALIGQTLIIGLIGFAGIMIAIVGMVLLMMGMLSAVDDNSGANLALFALLGFLLMIASVVVGAFFTVRLSVSGAALILENVGVWEGIRRSWNLTRGSFWRILGTLLLAGLITGAVSVVLAIPVGFISGIGAAFALGAAALITAVSTFLGSVVNAVIMPFSAAVTALIYIDLRMRQEGLDVELRRSAGV
ncbi:glycerophosphoryl diester phosphodiesterase membrane domain-containing protein [Actinomyces sp. MRS3W]|uniref:glycerophosphoryl diester phosphodiesterase membrane domain-containing protein n=1 Tax=Actinomyces sp. MRS3W TaxID=2800796 RepID=UPI0028FD7B09|nr:glycerophosphoryl diester phosphodiesterase membrane domain-containing protein [Actinomyces sp. MRS3W]MDU0349550.1 glycerophosphoryl diester phosphodiesterase membrane domain-containing protein [Actinomyces sp. MRS3W]